MRLCWSNQPRSNLLHGHLYAASVHDTTGPAVCSTGTGKTSKVKFVQQVCMIEYMYIMQCTCICFIDTYVVKAGPKQFKQLTKKVKIRILSQTRAMFHWPKYCRSILVLLRNAMFRFR